MNGFRAALGSLTGELFSRYEKQIVALADRKRAVFKLIDTDSMSDANHGEIFSICNQRLQRNSWIDAIWSDLRETD